MESSPTHRLKTKAVELGFTSIGIARAELLNEEENHLREWFARVIMLDAMAGGGYRETY